MVVQLDDHMLHRGHGVFDTAALVEGHLYQLDPHLRRCVAGALLVNCTHACVFGHRRRCRLQQG